MLLNKIGIVPASEFVILPAISYLALLVDCKFVTKTGRFSEFLHQETKRF